MTVLMMFGFGAFVYPACAESTAKAYQRLSAGIPFISYGDCYYRRTPWFLADNPDLAAAGGILKEAMGIATDLTELKSLVNHPDPNVRSLALLRLYDMDQPEAFPIIFSRHADNAMSFPDRHFLTENAAGKMELASEPIRVGEMAGTMLRLLGYPPEYHAKTPETFEEWSRLRLGNPEWAGWYAFLYSRATGRTSPIGKDRVPAIAALRKSVDALSPAARAWALMEIGPRDMDHNATSDPRQHIDLFATEPELVEAGRLLGPDDLLAFLRDGVRMGITGPSRDPSQVISGFVLSHARQLFRKQDFEALKTMGHPIAAGDADPESASAVIHAQIATMDPRYSGGDIGKAVASLVDLQGDREMAFVVKWFYDAPWQTAQSSSQTCFIDELKRRKPAEWKETIKSIVGHLGFEQLHKDDVAYLSLLVNALEGVEIVPLQSLTSNGSTPQTRDLLRRHFELPVPVLPLLKDFAGQDVLPAWSVELDGLPHSSSLSPDGKLIALGPVDGAVKLISTDDGKALADLSINGLNLSVRFRKSDGRLMVVDPSGVLTIWNVGTGKEISRATSGAYAFREGVLSDDGVTFAYLDKGLTAVDTGSGHVRWEVPMRIRSSGMLALSPDAARIAANDGFGKALRLFDGSSGTEVAVLEGTSDVSRPAGFSPDGTLVVASSESSKLLLWDGRSGKLLRQFFNPVGIFACWGFTADSKRIICSTDIGRFGLYDVETGVAEQGFANLPRPTGLSMIYHRDMLASADGTKLLGISQYSRGRDETPATRLECWKISKP